MKSSWPMSGEKIGSWAIGILVLGLIVVMNIGYTLTVPNNAVVYVDESKQTYLSPPLIETDTRDFLVLLPIAYVIKRDWKPATTEVLTLLFKNETKVNTLVYVDIKRKIYFVFPQDGYMLLQPTAKGTLIEKNYHPDPEHRERGGFVDDYGFWGFLKEIIGQRNARWTADGNWRW